jgi:hypothetical protein
MVRTSPEASPFSSVTTFKPTYCIEDGSTLPEQFVLVHWFCLHSYSQSLPLN